MPAINRMCDVSPSSTVFEVKFQECNTPHNGDKPYTTDRHLVESLDAALTVAEVAFEDCDERPQFRRTDLGLIFLWEPHDEDDEKYVRVSIRDRKVYE